MQAQGTPTTALATRLVVAVRIFAQSEVGWRAKLMSPPLCREQLCQQELDVRHRGAAHRGIRPAQA